MKKLLLSFALLVSCLVTNAQEYTVQSAGQGQGGRYLVAVQVSVKKLKTSAEDIAMHYATHGVLFRGLPAAEGYGEQKPLVKEPNAEQTKAEFFNAFFGEAKYRDFCSVVPGSVSSMKNKKTKKIETTATVSIDKEALQHYLEEAGVVKGFSNLW